MAVKRPKSINASAGSSGSGGTKKQAHYIKKCPKCQGKGIYTDSDRWGETDFPCDLCFSKGYIELTYDTNQYSAADGNDICDFLVERVMTKLENGDMSGGIMHPNLHSTEDLIKSDKGLSMLYNKLNGKN